MMVESVILELIFLITTGRDHTSDFSSLNLNPTQLNSTLNSTSLTSQLGPWTGAQTADPICQFRVSGFGFQGIELLLPFNVTLKRNSAARGSSSITSATSQLRVQCQSLSAETCHKQCSTSPLKHHHHTLLHKHTLYHSCFFHFAVFYNESWRNSLSACISCIRSKALIA